MSIYTQSHPPPKPWPVILGNGDGRFGQVVDGLDSSSEVIQSPPDSLVDGELANHVKPQSEPQTSIVGAKSMRKYSPDSLRRIRQAEAGSRQFPMGRPDPVKFTSYSRCWRRDLHRHQVPTTPMRRSVCNRSWPLITSNFAASARSSGCLAILRNPFRRRQTTFCESPHNSLR